MPASKLPQPSPESLDSHDALLQREAVSMRRRRRRLALGAALALGLVAAVVVGARPAVHGVKAWQARRLAKQATELTAAGRLDEARVKVQDALEIWRQEPEALHAAAAFLTRAGAYKQALDFWLPLDKAGTLTGEDVRAYALTQLSLGDLDTAEALARRAWPDGPAGGTRQDWILALQIALRRAHPGEAAALAAKILRDEATPAHERLQAAVTLATSSAAPPEDRAMAWQDIVALARSDKTPESLAALVLLAQARAGAGAAALPTDVPQLPELLARIDAHPLAKAAQSLLALDLRLSQEPARRSEFIQTASDRYGQSKDDADLAALGAWLYGKGEYEAVLTVLPLTRVGNDRALYLQRLDALAALGRWTDIRTVIQSRKYPLDPVLSEMFLARCAEQLGETEVRNARWRGALDAAGKDPAKLIAVGQYAAKNNNDEVATTAFEAAVRAAPDSRPAHEELVRYLEGASDTQRLRAAVAALLSHWPQDVAARNDSAYLDALLGDNLPAARQTARELVRAQPANLNFRVTLALCELRLHDGLAALEAFDRRNLREGATLLPRQAAVYAAVLWEDSFVPEAFSTVKSIPTERLLPQERELIRPIQEAGAR